MLFDPFSIARPEESVRYKVVQVLKTQNVCEWIVPFPFAGLLGGDNSVSDSSRFSSEPWHHPKDLP